MDDAAPDLRCYYHPERAATSQCDRCGDYLCGECVLYREGEHNCRTCYRLLVLPRTPALFWPAVLVNVAGIGLTWMGRLGEEIRLTGLAFLAAAAVAAMLIRWAGAGPRMYARHGWALLLVSAGAFLPGAACWLRPYLRDSAIWGAEPLVGIASIVLGAWAVNIVSLMEGRTTSPAMKVALVSSAIAAMATGLVCLAP